MRISGFWMAVASYVLWGAFPIYWRLLQQVPALEILAHRVVWALVFCAALMSLTRGWRWLSALKGQPRVWGLLLASTVAISINWLTYIWSVNAGHVVDASLGYFINPFVSILAGMLIFNERLRRGQIAAILVAACGVLYLAIASNTLLWIAVTLALSFGAYGVLRKLAPVDSLQGLTIETAIIAPIALIYLICCAIWGSNAFVSGGFVPTTLLLLSGVVTAIPLLLFASGARALPLTLVGVLQYITPTIQFMIGVFVYREAFNTVQMVGYGLVWVALLTYAIESVLHARRELNTRISDRLRCQAC
jgi:chloramphenicol-sensitive protein RarD